jgi:hypothetical protein
VFGMFAKEGWKPEERRYVFVGREIVTKFFAAPAYGGKEARIEYHDEVVNRLVLAEEETMHAYEEFDEVYLNGEYVRIRSITRSPDMSAYVVETNKIVSMTRDAESYEQAKVTLAKFQQKHIEEVKRKYER